MNILLTGYGSQKKKYPNNTAQLWNVEVNYLETNLKSAASLQNKWLESHYSFNFDLNVL